MSHLWAGQSVGESRFQLSSPRWLPPLRAPLPRDRVLTSSTTVTDRAQQHARALRGPLAVPLETSVWKVSSHHSPTRDRGHEQAKCRQAFLTYWIGRFVPSLWGSVKGRAERKANQVSSPRRRISVLTRSVPGAQSRLLQAVSYSPASGRSPDQRCPLPPPTGVLL